MGCSNCQYNLSNYENGNIIIGRPSSTVISCKLDFPIECKEGRLPRELPKIETDIEFIPLPKENQESKEYKAKIIDSKTGEVIKEGIWNTKGEFKEDKNND